MVVMATKDDINQETEAGTVLSTRKRNLTTLLVTAAAFGNGLCFGVWGPALLDFQNLVNTSQEKISLIFTARSVGALIVMFTVSPLYDKLNTFFLFILSLVCIIVAMAAAPWSVNLAMLIAVSTVLGAALAAVFAGANTVLIRMWKEKVGPILQTMYLFFIGGNMIVPQVVRPFLGQVAMETEGQLPARTNQTSWNPNLGIRNMKEVLYTVENTTRIKNSTEDLFKFNNLTDMPYDC